MKMASDYRHVTSFILITIYKCIKSDIDRNQCRTTYLFAYSIYIAPFIFHMFKWTKNSIYYKINIPNFPNKACSNQNETISQMDWHSKQNIFHN